MDSPTIYQATTAIISIVSIVIAYFGFIAKKSDKTDRDLQDRIKATVLSDAVSVKAEALSAAVSAKAAILSEAVNAKAIEIKNLQDQSNDTDNKLNIIEERIAVLTEISDTNSEKIHELEINTSVQSERLSNIINNIDKIIEKLDSKD